MSSDVEKPRSKSTDKCPHFKKEMRDVCHTCVFWEHIKGRHPQTGEPIDRWGCIEVHKFMLGLENNKVTYEQGAAIESLRNEMVEYQRLAIRAQFHRDPETMKFIEVEFERLDKKELPGTSHAQLPGLQVRNVRDNQGVDLTSAGEVVGKRIQKDKKQRRRHSAG